MHVVKARELTQQTCAEYNRPYALQKGDIIDGFASRYAINVASRALYRRTAHPNVFHVDQSLCLAGRTWNRHIMRVRRSTAHYTPARSRKLALHHSSKRRQIQAPWRLPIIRAALLYVHTIGSPAAGDRNTFPYGTCTWWANHRYYQLHGVYVPWLYNANALQWTERALEYGWYVSDTPHVGDIIDLQPGIQGAYDLGHVAVVEKVLDDGHVIASSMSWGAHPWAVTHFHFTPGPGVTFIGM
jgi:hypothetical protein